MHGRADEEQGSGHKLRLAWIADAERKQKRMC